MTMKTRLTLLFAFAAIVCAAANRVSLQDLQTNGWEQYKGQRIILTTPLMVCGSFYDSLILAPERLFVPEERAVGLAQGDSTAYWQRVAYNQSQRIKLVCKAPYYLNLGATVKNLEAFVMGERSLQTGQQPKFKNYTPSKRVPDLGRHDLLICSANIQNYFVHFGGYASKRTTPQQHALQRLKVASALTRFNADLYTLCELEKGPSAPADLAAAMNEVSRQKTADGQPIYRFVHTSDTDGDTISVGFIYRSDRLKPYGELRCAYHAPDIYAYRFMLQGFEDLRTGERFVVSLNHPRSKRGDAETANALRMENIASMIWNIHKAYADDTYSDPDILMLGDYNCYRYEEPLQTLVELGYQDMLAGDSLNYSYSYKGECGSLDRVFASPTMAAQITGVAHVHWNTDYYYSAVYYSKYNFKSVKDTNRSADRVQAEFRTCKDIKPYMTKAAKKNLLFRYSDHDPVLIGIKFK